MLDTAKSSHNTSEVDPVPDFHDKLVRHVTIIALLHFHMNEPPPRLDDDDISVDLPTEYQVMGAFPKYDLAKNVTEAQINRNKSGFGVRNSGFGWIFRLPNPEPRVPNPEF